MHVQLNSNSLIFLNNHVSSGRNMQLPLIIVTILVGSVADGARLIKAPANEVVSDSYLIHVKPRTPPSMLRKLINRLHQIDTEVSNCTAKVSCVLNRVAYGFTANLSSNVLQQVCDL